MPENTLRLVAEYNEGVACFVSAGLVPSMGEAAWPFVRDVGYTRLMIDALVVEPASWHRGVGTTL